LQLRVRALWKRLDQLFGKRINCLVAPPMTRSAACNVCKIRDRSESLTASARVTGATRREAERFSFVSRAIFLNEREHPSGLNVLSKAKEQGDSRS
jgi:hypothetical protein